MEWKMVQDVMSVLRENMSLRPKGRSVPSRNTSALGGGVFHLLVSQSLMLTNAVLTVGSMVNWFPRKSGVSADISPRQLLTGEQLSDKLLGPTVGTYCQVHENDEPHNSQMADKIRKIPKVLENLKQEIRRNLVNTIALVVDLHHFRPTQEEYPEQSTHKTSRVRKTISRELEDKVNC